jgi:tellurite methyltransferase
MTDHDRVRWDDIYRQRHQRAYPPPDPLLLNYTPPVSAPRVARALDLAGGQGQNGLWLAEQGYTVDILDISRVALSRARDAMTARGLRSVNLLQMDLDTVELNTEYYDLVCVFRFLKRDFLPRLRASVAIGGRVIYQTFNLRYLETVPEFNPAYLLNPGELEAMFAGWRVVYYDETGPSSQIVALKETSADQPATSEADHLTDAW